MHTYISLTAVKGSSGSDFDERRSITGFTAAFYICKIFYHWNDLLILPHGEHCKTTLDGG